MADRLPELRLPPRIGLEPERLVKQGQPVVDLVAADGQVCGSPRPGDRPGTQPLDVLLAARPGKIEVIRADRLRIVVREQRRVLVAPLSPAFEPAAKAACRCPRTAFGRLA